MITINMQSQFTGKTNTMQFCMTDDDFNACWKRWQSGALIQDAFPMLNDDEREFLLSGSTPEEWDEAFPDE